MIWHGGKIAKANSFVSADTKLKGMIYALGGASSGRKSGRGCDSTRTLFDFLQSAVEYRGRKLLPLIIRRINRGKG